MIIMILVSFWVMILPQFSVNLRGNEELNLDDVCGEAIDEVGLEKADNGEVRVPVFALGGRQGDHNYEHKRNDEAHNLGE